MIAAVLVPMFGVSMLAHYAFHFADRDDRQEAAEHEEQGCKQPEAADKHSDIDPSWREVSPA